MISFNLAHNDRVELALYNFSGQKVTTLAEGAREAGAYTVKWDGRGGRGQVLASGVNLFRRRAEGGQEETRPQRRSFQALE